MANRSQYIRQFEGLVPALDPRQSTKPLLIEGRNTLVTVEGPKSAFAADLATQDKLYNAEYVATFDVDDEIFIMSKGTVLKYDTVLGLYYSLYNFTDDGTLRPWTHTKIGLKHHFARRGVGELIYDPIADLWKTGNADVVSVARSGGRLIYLTDFVVGWSAIDDGEDVATSTTTGAGFQSLAIIGGGAAFYVIASSQGFVTYIEGGAQISQLIESINPFRHIPMVDPQVPVNAFCIAATENNRHIILSETGLYELQGSQLVEIQPLFNEFIHETLFDTVAYNTHGIVKLTYNAQKKHLYLSISENERLAEYTKAWVLAKQLDKWGSFNRNHKTFGQFRTGVSASDGFNFGFIDFESLVYEFKDTDRFEVGLDNTLAMFWRLPGDTSPWLENNGSEIHHYQDHMQIYTEDITPKAGQKSTYYATLTSTLVAHDFTHTESKIIVGPFRLLLDENDNVTRLSDILTVTVGIPGQVADESSEDWGNFEAPVAENWLDDTTNTRGNQNWGEGGSGFGTDFQLTLKGTLDADIVFESNEEILTPVSANDLLDRFINYDADSNGLYHIVEVETVTFGQSFHLRLLEVTGIIAGILGD